MRHLRSFLILSALPVFFSSCSLLSGRCLYELRNVIADGTVLENNVETASAHLVESEQRDYQPDKNMSWQITGDALKGHVTRISLRDGNTLRYDFPISTGSQPVLSSGFVRQSEGANINGFFDLLSSRNATIVISTDLPVRPTVTIPLLSVQSDDWSRPYCS